LTIILILIILKNAETRYFSLRQENPAEARVTRNSSACIKTPDK